MKETFYRVLYALRELGLLCLCVRQDARQLFVIITGMLESRGYTLVLTWIANALCINARVATDVAKDFSNKVDIGVPEA